MYIEQVKPKIWFEKINGLKLAIKNWTSNSSGINLLILHGWMDNSATFQFLVDKLDHKRFNIFSFDWRGMGLSEHQAIGYYDRFMMLDDLIKIIDKIFKNQHFHIVGHSLGGMLAMKYASLNPDYLKSMVLIEAFGMKNIDMANMPNRVKTFVEELSYVRPFNKVYSKDNFAQKLIKRNPFLSLDKSKYIAEHFLKEKGKEEFFNIADCKHKITQPFIYNFEIEKYYWQNIINPILWVEGDLVPHNKYLAEINDELDYRATYLKNFVRIKIKNTGHMIHWEATAELAYHINNFL